MIKTTRMLINELSEYANPSKKIERLVASKKLIPIKRGLYETNPYTDGQYLAGCICSPSYLSFDYALSLYGLIPEAVYEYTSATFQKNKKKEFRNYFGRFSYRDIPSKAFPYGIKIISENDYVYKIATPEKALCDKLYSLAPLQNQKQLSDLLFDDLRIDKEEFFKLNKEDIFIFEQLYKCSNITLLSKYIKRIK